MQMKFIIDGQELRVTQGNMVAGTRNFLEAEFAFSQQWDGLSKWAHFRCGKENYQIELINDRITRDRGLNLNGGVWQVWMHGTSADGMRITTGSVLVEVRGTGCLNGEPLPRIPLTAAEQIERKAIDALAIAKEVERKADNGEFNGKDGAPYDHSEEFSQLAAQVKADAESSSSLHSAVEQLTEQVQTNADKAATAADRAAHMVDDNAISDSSAWSSKKIHAQTIQLAIKSAADGEVISVKDSALYMPVNFSVIGKTIQNGVPSPEQPAPLVSAGKNGSIKETITGLNVLTLPYLNQTSLAGSITFHVNNDGSVTVKGSNPYTTVFNLTNVLPLQNGVTYWKHLEIIGQGKCSLVFRYRDHQGMVQYSPHKYIQWADGMTFEMLYLQVPANTVVDLVARPSVTVETEPLGYTPVNMQSFTIPIQDGLCGIKTHFMGNYVDDKGQQWVTDEVDLQKGIYIKRVQVTDKIQYVGEKDNIDEYFINVPVNPQFVNEHSIGMCSVTNTIEYGVDSKTNFYCTSDGVRIFVKKGTAPAAISVAVPVQETVTPIAPEVLIEYQKCHMNYPFTTVFNDSGARQILTYVADPRNYIDSKLVSMHNAMVRLGGNI